MSSLRALLAAAGLTLALAAPAQAAFPGQNGRISFSSQGDLWSMAADGSDARRLTTTPEEEAQSAFSPGGAMIAYRRRPAAGEAYQIYVAQADGSGQRRVSSSTVNETQPGWSPDGRRLIYRRSVVGDPHAEVWSMAVNGTDARPLVTTPGFDERYPVFSPDGARIAFTSDRDGQYEVYVAAADGTGQTRLTSDPGYDSAPSWSPDGGRLAFERGMALDVDETKDVWIMGADGSAQTRLTSTDGVVDEGPAFSPDGRQIAFTSGRDGNYEIYRMAADGSAQTRLTTLPTKEESPDWQSLPAAPLPPGGPPPPGPGPAALPTVFTSKLALGRANTAGGVIDVLAPITARASGRVNVEYHAAGRRTRFTAPVDVFGRRVRFRRSVPKAQARLGTGILTIDYPGDADTRPQSVRLRAARNKAALDLRRPTLVDGRLRASGTISSRARGVVRLQLEYVVAGRTRTLELRGTIANGRWSIDETLTGPQRSEIALRTGTVHSYTAFTGYFPSRIRGEMRAFQVLGDR